MAKYVSFKKTIIFCLLSASFAFAGSYAFMKYKFNSELPVYKELEKVYGKMGEIKKIIDSYYVGEYDVKEAIDMASAGYIDGINDIWSTYMSKEEHESYKLRASGKSFGVGLYTSYKNDVIKIVEVFEGSDAQKLGLKKGDIILGAEGKTVEKDGYKEVVNAISGDEGTMAQVLVLFSDTNETKTVEMERKTTKAIMASGEMLSDEKTGMIRIYNFNKGSDKQIIKIIDNLIENGAKQLVFDVRNNPGGSVSAVCNALDYIVPKGNIITLKTKKGDENVYSSDKNEIKLPMAVLINKNSVSAAEFFAAVLQEYEKAVIVGQKTIGKGYAQQTYELSDGSALHLSDQTYFTPSGKSLIGKGVIPDIEIKEKDDFDIYFTNEKDDVQLKAALNNLNNK